MEFVEANYIWIVIVIAVLVMTLIGYIADKSNLLKSKGNKKKRGDFLDESDEFPESVNDSENIIFEEEPEQLRSSLTEESVIENINPESESIEEIKEYDPINDEIIPQQEKIVEEKTNSDEEYQDEEIKMSEIEEPEQLGTDLTEEESAELYGIEFEKEQEDDSKMDDIPNEPETDLLRKEKVLGEDKETVEIELPNLDEINPDLTEEEEDVWRF